MPTKKKKYNARFPPARIKKIMQTDEEIGKVAAPVPVIISRVLELFIESLVQKSGDVTLQKNAKTLTAGHIKQAIVSDEKYQFLKGLVTNISDASPSEDDEPAPREREVPSTSTSRVQTTTTTTTAAAAGTRPRGRPRKQKPETQSAAGSSSPGGTAMPPKRRGRPPKKIVVETKSEDEEMMEENSTDDSEAEDDESTDENEELIDEGPPPPPISEQRPVDYSSSSTFLPTVGSGASTGNNPGPPCFNPGYGMSASHDPSSPSLPSNSHTMSLPAGVYSSSSEQRFAVDHCVESLPPSLLSGRGPSVLPSGAASVLPNASVLPLHYYGRQPSSSASTSPLLATLPVDASSTLPQVAPPPSTVRLLSPMTPSATVASPGFATHRMPPILSLSGSSLGQLSSASYAANARLGGQMSPSIGRAAPLRTPSRSSSTTDVTDV